MTTVTVMDIQVRSTLCPSAALLNTVTSLGTRKDVPPLWPPHTAVERPKNYES